MKILSSGKYKILATRGCGAILLGGLIAAVIVCALALYAGGGGKTSLFQSAEDNAFVFPASDAEMQVIAQKMLARQGVALESDLDAVEPAAGKSE